MNKLFKTILFFFMMFCFQNSYSQYKKVSLDSLDYNIRWRVYDFAFNLYNAKSIDQFPKLNKNIATNYFRKRYNKYTSSINEIGNTWYFEHYGDVKAMKLFEVLKTKKDRLIYRYKVSHTETNFFSEINITLNRESQYIGMTRKVYWKDEYEAGNNTLKQINLPISILDKDVIEDNRLFVRKSYDKCVKEEMYPLNRNNTTYYSHNKDFGDLILKSCDSTKNKYGDLNYFKLTEVLTDSFTYKAYRYKAIFEKKKDTLEIRVYTSFDNKLSGLWEVYWYDDYNNVNKMPRKLD